VLECRPELSVVCFNVHWGIASSLAERGWPTAAIRQDDPIPQTCRSLLDAAVDLPLLIVVRDAGLRPWQQSVIDHCVQHHPGLVVVAELGWPATDPSRDAVVTVVTHGAARCSAQALIDLLVKES
jgi:hypothetical protein